MTPREHESTLDRTALYVSGAMSAEEQAAFEQDVEADRDGLRDALETMMPAVEALADSCGAIEPTERLRASVLRVVEPMTTAPADEQQRWRGWVSDESSELFTLRADEGHWEPTGVDGVEVRRLFVDQQSNRMTGMFRMAPGTSYPSHVHDGAEECFVLHGDLHVGQVVLRAGDYQRAPAESHHVVQWTEGGCVLLVTSSLSDELDG